MSPSPKLVCPTCGYDLTCCPNTSCPECGENYWITVSTAGSVARRQLWRFLPAIASVGIFGFFALTISAGSIAYWWSPFAACTVWLCTFLLLMCVFGTRVPAQAFRIWLLGVGDERARANAAVVFKCAATISLCCGGLGCAIGGGEYVSVRMSADMSAIANIFANITMCPLYALLVSLPCFACSAELLHRANTINRGMLTTESPGPWAR